MNYPVFDLHCDTALAMLDKELRHTKGLKSNDGHIDLERAARLPGYAQCFACFTTTWEELPGGLTVTDLFEREMLAVLTELERNKDSIALAHSMDEVRKNQTQGKMSAILTIEGPAGIGFDPALLEDLYKIGFRASTLTWNERNPLAGSHVTGGGLTDQGREYVKECQRLGILVDVSHLSDEAFWNIMDMTTEPVIATHSNSRAVHPVSRNLTDDMFRAIRDTGGVAGINLYNAFLGEEPVTLDRVCDHIFHFLELDPEGKHICLGGDLDGCEALPEGFTGIDSYQALADRLERRGLSGGMVYDIFWNNAIEVMERAVHKHPV